MDRRRFVFTALLTPLALYGLVALPPVARAGHNKLQPLVLSDQQWRLRLTPPQFRILRDEGTERAFTSPLNNEKRRGIYACAGCELPLFESTHKYDSGTGWPSFTQAIAGHTDTRLDFKTLWPRTEYHCARCGGHQGHIFDDGPQPLGKRWCNNGLALTFNDQA